MRNPFSGTAAWFFVIILKFIFIPCFVRVNNTFLTFIFVQKCATYRRLSIYDKNPKLPKNTSIKSISKSNEFRKYLIFRRNYPQIYFTVLSRSRGIRVKILKISWNNLKDFLHIELELNPNELLLTLILKLLYYVYYVPKVTSQYSLAHMTWRSILKEVFRKIWPSGQHYF